MTSPNFSRVFEVTIKKYKITESLWGPTIPDDVSSEEEVVVLLADGLEEAIEKGNEYADAMMPSGNWKVYEIVSAKFITDVLVGFDVDDEVEIVYTPEDGAYSKELLALSEEK